MSEKTVDIKKLFEAYAEDITSVEQHMRTMFQSDVSIIPAIGNYIISSGGKRMRPLFLILSAKLCGYQGTDHLTLASIIESIHTASLLHDDVVDGADFRRGNESANALWGNQVVILVGDYMYSNALKRTVEFKNQHLFEILSHATTRMTLGELRQMQKSHSPDITEDEYFEIISAKTGALISAATRVGAVLGQCTPEQEDAMGDFGLKAGNAFQVVDDVLDYQADEGALGKRLGKDLQEGKVTLPLIYLLKSVNKTEHADVSEILASETISQQQLSRILELLKHHDAGQQAMQRAHRLVEEAKTHLLAFPACLEREHLFEMADYALMREK